MRKTYSEAIRIPDFVERFNYLKLNGTAGEMNEEVNRYLNQYFYHTPEWKSARRQVLIRDDGYDLGHRDHLITGRSVIHHITPITKQNVLDRDPIIFDPDNLILCSHETHNALHYGSAILLKTDYVERKPGDTCPWK